MKVIKNLSDRVEIKVEDTGEIISVDFTDKRFTNKLLHLVKRYRGLSSEIESKSNEIANSSDDDFEKLIKASDLEVEVLTDFKKDVDDTFNCDIVEKMFGDTLPDIAKYLPMFDAITPYIVASKKKEDAAIAEISKKYGINMDSPVTASPIPVDKEDVVTTPVDKEDASVGA